MARRKTARKLAAESSLASRLGSFWPAVLIVGAALLVYLPGIHGGFILDDDLYLTQNALVAAPDGLHSFWFTTQAIDYYPVTYTTLWLEWRLWGLNPTGYHVTNLILHAVASLLVWLVLKQLRVPGAFLAALIFAVHPVNVESVEWIAQRKGLLAMVFFLLSVLWYVRSQIDTPAVDRWYCLSILAFVLGTLSKSSVATLPLVLLAVVWWKRPITRRDWMRLAPFFLLAVVLVKVNVWFQARSIGEFVRPAGFVERVLTASAVVWFYLYKAVFPFHLVFIYPQWIVRVSDPRWWAPLVACIVVSLVLWRLRNGWGRPLLMAWIYFCVMLVPVMGFTDFGFMKYSLVADHYQYIAIVSVTALVSAGWSLWRQRGSPSTRKFAMAIAVLGIGLLIILSWRQLQLYRDAPTLYQATTEQNPACWIAHYNLGCILSDRNEFPQAIARFEQALKYNSDYPEAHDNLGVALARQGRFPEAIEHYRQAIRIKPDSARAHLNLGISLAYIGQIEDGISEFHEAIRLQPELAEAHFNLAGALALQGQKPEAFASYQEALKLKPDSPETYVRLATLLAEDGKFDPASAYFAQALKLRPDQVEAHQRLGAICVAQGKLDEAIRHFLRVVQIKPDFIDGYLYLANVYAAAGRPADAIAAAHTGIQTAQSTGQSEPAQRIDTWLKNYKPVPPKQ